MLRALGKNIRVKFGTISLFEIISTLEADIGKNVEILWESLLNTEFVHISEQEFLVELISDPKDKE